MKLLSPLSLADAAIRSPNLCSRFTKEDLITIGEHVAEGYEDDEASRASWLRRNEAGMDLALQLTKDKSFPWPNCSNVAFPLVTIAALQFHARAYPAIVDGPNLVKCAYAQDPARADRISRHMSWQLLHQDLEWEAQEDVALLNLPIVGSNFKKVYYSDSKTHNVSGLVLSKDLVMNYWSKSVTDSPRKTHRIWLSRNTVYERVMRGIYENVLEEPWFQDPSRPKTLPGTAEADRRKGMIQSQPDAATSILFYEQHVNLDLDDDNYDEPYVITVEASSKRVVRIVTRFDRTSSIERVASGKDKGKIIKITPTEYFSPKIFIPSPDGGVYGMGFGLFLGPLNEAVNSLVNMLIDSGTLQTTSGGFLGRGAKIRSGTMNFSPFEWKRVDAAGDDLRKNIVQLPVNAPSDVLFQLLSLLINYTSRVAGTTDTTVGENPGQNTPASTMQTMVEMGQKVYTAIFKRIWRGSAEEFRRLYTLNSIYLPEDRTFPGGATLKDYESPVDEVCPVADPNMISDSMKIQQAVALKSAAMSTPGYDKDAVELRFLRALRVEKPEELFKGGANQPPPPDPRVQTAQIKAQTDAAQLQADMQLAAMELQAKQQEFAISLLEERRLNNAKILELMAKAEEAAANAQSEQAYAQVALVNAQISQLKGANEHIVSRVQTLLKAAEIQADHDLRLKELAAKKAAANGN
jgi:chaperonin GroES